MTNATVIAVPASGPVKLPCGRELRTMPILGHAMPTDDLPPLALLLRCVERAARDNQIVCLRPTGDRPARFGLTRQEAINAVHDEPERVITVDPYTLDGAPIRFGHGTLVRFAPFNLASR